MAVLLDLFFAWFFYRSLWAVLPLSPIGILAFNTVRFHRKRKQQEELKIEFKECIMTVSAALQTGYSVENAFLLCEQDMVQLYGTDALIVSELRLIRRGLHINIALEELLMDFGNRSSCEEILQFAEVFSIAKRNGGNLPDLIQNCGDMIGRKVDLKQEITALLSAKRMELGIMETMPFFILLYVGFSSPGYFDSLFFNLRGVVVMTACLIIYLGAYAIGEWILRQLSDRFV